LNETDGLGNGDSVWVRQIINDQYALGIVSARTDGTPRSIQFTLKQAGFKDIGSGLYTCVDLFDSSAPLEIWNMKDIITLYVNPDSIIMYRCSPPG